MTAIDFDDKLDRFNTAITIADTDAPDAPLIYINKAFYDLTGYSADRCIGQNCRFLQGKGTNPKTVQKIRDAVKNKETLEACLLNYRKDGQPFHNLLLMTKLVLSDGKDYLLGCQYEINPRMLRIEDHLREVDGVIGALQVPSDHPWHIVSDAMRMRSEAVITMVQTYIGNERIVFSH